MLGCSTIGISFSRVTLAGDGGPVVVSWVTRRTGMQLRSWRTRVQSADVGLPFGRNPRTAQGLHREEVAWLAGVLPDYVKRLERPCAHERCQASSPFSWARAVRGPAGVAV